MATGLDDAERPAASTSRRPQTERSFPRWLVILAIFGLLELNLLIYWPLLARIMNPHRPAAPPLRPAPPSPTSLEPRATPMRPDLPVA